MLLSSQSFVFIQRAPEGLLLSFPVKTPHPGLLFLQVSWSLVPVFSSPSALCAQ